MNILFDHQIYTNQTFGGISRYFYELSQGLIEHGNRVINTTRYSQNIFTEDKAVYESTKPFPITKHFKGKGQLIEFCNKQISKKHITRNHFDIFHPTYYDTYFFDKIKKKPIVVTCYDLIHEKFRNQYPELSSENLYHRKELFKRADHLIAISNSTKQDMVDLYNIHPDKITVTYLGNSLKTNESTKENDTKKSSTILFVGNRGMYKNFILFVSAVAPLLKKETEVRVVCAGSSGFTDAEISLFKSKGIENQMVHESINDNILTRLYQESLMFVFPSLYEGFGIPVLEAFACDCPVVLSNSSSLPEVGGDAALYFDPYSIEDLTSKIEKLFYNSSLRQELIIKGKKQLQRFSWEKMTMNTINIYKSLL